MNIKVVKVALSMTLCTMLGILAAGFIPKRLLAGLPAHLMEPRQLVLVGAVTGFLVGLTLGLYWVSKKRRWLLVVLLNVELVLSALVGGRLGLVLTATATALTFSISAFSIRALFDDDEWAALRHHIKLVLGIVQGFQVIDEGKTTFPPGSGQLLGPRLIIIRPWNAVVMQSGARQTRISGPRILTSEPFEYVSRVYDLREKQKSLNVADVLTKDAVSVTLSITLSYSPNIHANARRGDRPFVPAETEAIALLMSTMPEWETAVKVAVEQSARRAVGAWPLNELLDSRQLLRLADRIRSLANNHTLPWGVRVHQVVVENLQPQPEVKQTTTGRWVAAEQFDAVVATEIARASAARDALALLAEGYANAKARGMSTVEIGIEALRRTFEQVHDNERPGSDERK